MGLKKVKSGAAKAGAAKAGAAKAGAAKTGAAKMGTKSTRLAKSRKPGVKPVKKVAVLAAKRAPKLKASSIQAISRPGGVSSKKTVPAEEGGQKGHSRTSGGRRVSDKVPPLPRGKAVPVLAAATATEGKTVSSKAPVRTMTGAPVDLDRGEVATVASTIAGHGAGGGEEGSSTGNVVGDGDAPQLPIPIASFTI